ncbi:MAG: D-alanine--D-alanine ligase family protein [Solirubrobacteraceae bacterium]
MSAASASADRPVLVAMGGSSLEREISLRSGHRVERALRTLGYSVHGADVDARLIDRIAELEPRFVFIAMHGRGGEDGTLQELLETLSVPYTGSDALASALCMDKVLFKRLLAKHGVPTPHFHSFSETAFREMGAAGAFPTLLAQLRLPVVVKPVAQGSAIGIKFVDSAERFPSAILGAFGYGDRVLIERRVLGRELAVTVIGPPESALALPIVELHTPGGFYSYEAHYTIGGVRLEAPAELSEAVRKRVERVALDSYRLIGCRDFARVDLILDQDEQPQVLEINTIPGLTETGITPAAAEAGGMSFTQLVAEIVSRVAG